MSSFITYVESKELEECAELFEKKFLHMDLDDAMVKIECLKMAHMQMLCEKIEILSHHVERLDCCR